MTDHQIFFPIKCENYSKLCTYYAKNTKIILVFSFQLMATGEIGRHTVFARPHVEEESVIVSDCVTDHQLRTTVNRVSCRTVADEDIGSKVNEIKVVTQNHVQVCHTFSKYFFNQIFPFVTA